MGIGICSTCKQYILLGRCVCEPFDQDQSFTEEDRYFLIAHLIDPYDLYLREEAA